MRYIDADALYRDEIARCHCVPLVGSGADNFKLLKEVLEEAPTADVVEVLRCKDCAYWWGNNETSHCAYEFTDADDYCSGGERIKR